MSGRFQIICLTTIEEVIALVLSKMVVCKECEGHFHNKSNLNRHIQAFHPDIYESDASEEEDMISDAESEDSLKVDVWPIIKAINEKDVLRGFKHFVILCRSFKKEEAYQAVNNTVTKAQQDDDMDFEEALDYAIERRKFLIYRSAKDSKPDEEE